MTDIKSEIDNAEEAAEHYGLGINGLVCTTLRKAKREIERLEELLISTPKCETCGAHLPLRCGRKDCGAVAGRIP